MAIQKEIMMSVTEKNQFLSKNLKRKPGEGVTESARRLFQVMDEADEEAIRFEEWARNPENEKLYLSLPTIERMKLMEKVMRPDVVLVDPEED